MTKLQFQLNGTTIENLRGHLKKRVKEWFAPITFD